MFDSYKPGSDLTIMNTFYQYGIRDEEGHKYPDYLVVNFKDNTTGKKHHEIIKHPEIEFFTDGSTYDKRKVQIAVYKYRYQDPDKKREEEITRRTLIRYPDEIVYDESKDEYVIILAMEFDPDERYIHIPKNKMMYFYELNDGDLGYPKLFEDEDNLVRHTCKYAEVDKYLCKLSNNMDFYNKCIQNNDRGTIKMIHFLTGIYRSDLNIEAYARYVFANKFTNNIERITKAYYDIETDFEKSPMKGDRIAADGSVPINAFAYMDTSNPEQYIVYQFLLRDPTNPQIAVYEEEYKSGKFGEAQIRDFVLSKMGKKRFYKYRMDKCRYKLLFYTDELQMLVDVFALINKSSPDFCGGWNSSAFDFEFIMNRIRALGYEPEQVMCDPKWEIKKVKNYVDQKNISDLAERGDFTFVSGDTIYTDLEIQFASRRKSKIGSFDSFKLDDIGKLTTGINKLDYSHITNNILLLPKLSYKTFSLYNIFDVIVLHCIEFKNNDLEYLFSQAILNNTTYNKAHRQTQYLINKMINNFETTEGFVLTNNRNKVNIKRKKKFPGALVHDPTKTSDKPKIKLDGIPIMVCDNLQDFDYRALYPSITLQFGIAPNTIIGRINIPVKVYENENPFLNEKYNRGGDFIENLVSDNIVEFCRRWLHLAGFKEFLEDMQEYYGTDTKISCKITYDTLVSIDKDKGQDALIFFDDINDMIQNPFIFIKEREINADGTPRRS